MSIMDAVVNGGLKMAVKLRKIRMNKVMLRIAACFIDYEAESLAPDSRVIEYGFTLAKISEMPIGTALDVGCIARHNYLIPMMCFAGWDVYGIDIRDGWGYEHPNFHFTRGDIRDNTFNDNEFDMVSCISAIEHMGTTSYYGETKIEEDADFHVLQEIKRILKPGGVLLITVPYRKVGAARPGYKIYDSRFFAMFCDMEIMEEVIYRKDNIRGWILADRDIEIEGVLCLAVRKK